MPAYYGEVKPAVRWTAVCSVHEMIGWEKSIPCAIWETAKCAPWAWPWPCRAPVFPVWMWAADIKLNDDGFYTLRSVRPIWEPAAIRFWRRWPPKCWMCPMDNVTVFGADTDTSPYDSGSYASSTTYITGKAVEKRHASCRNGSAAGRRAAECRK